MLPKIILVPTDFSHPSNDALAYAKGLAETFSASIHLLHVVENPLSQPWALEAYAIPLDEVLADFKARGQKELEETMPQADRKKYHAELVIGVGSPFSEILDYAKAHHVDLIVMGTRGRGAVAHVILGSVAERVVRYAPCPVLTVRQGKEQVKAAA
jgi:nucleotide-binding universal stress UspA family protein